MENKLVKINETDIQLREYQGVRVVTFKDIDTVHGKTGEVARRNFNRNRKHFIEGEDYFGTDCHEAKELFGITAPSGITLITESGYLMLVKSFTDDLAWKVQRELVNNYFRRKETTQVQPVDQFEKTKQEYLKILGEREQATENKRKYYKKYVEWLEIEQRYNSIIDQYKKVIQRQESKALGKLMEGIQLSFEDI